MARTKSTSQYRQISAHIQPLQTLEKNIFCEATPMKVKPTTPATPAVAKYRSVVPKVVSRVLKPVSTNKQTDKKLNGKKNGSKINAPPEDNLLESSPPVYWCEADKAILMQLHKKHFDLKPALKDSDWDEITNKYNIVALTSRTKSEIQNQWGKMLAKYHAERNILRERKTSPLQTYWQHYIFLDSYLMHLEITEKMIKQYIDCKEEDPYVLADGTKVVPAELYLQEQKKRLAQEDRLRWLEEQHVRGEQNLDRSFAAINSLSEKLYITYKDIVGMNEDKEEKLLSVMKKYLENKVLMDKKKIPLQHHKCRRKKNQVYKLSIKKMYKV